jgi:hypothetical protein
MTYTSTHMFSTPFHTCFSTIARSVLPLLLANDTDPKTGKKVQVSEFWARVPRLHEVVALAWEKPSGHNEPFQIRFGRLKHTAKQCLFMLSCALLYGGV